MLLDRTWKQIKIIACIYAEHGKCQKEAQVDTIIQYFINLAIGGS
jgi:hypothetical protein